MSIKQIFLNHMADSFLLLSWANYSDERGLTRAGQNFTVRNMPEPAEYVRQEAQEEAQKLYDTIEAHWRKETGDEHLLVWFVVTLDLRMPRFRNDDSADIENWCHYAVMSGVGHGVSWEDDHPSIQAQTADGRVVEVEVHSYLNTDEPMWEHAPENVYYWRCPCGWINETSRSDGTLWPIGSGLLQVKRNGMVQCIQGQDSTTGCTNRKPFIAGEHLERVDVAELYEEDWE